MAKDSSLEKYELPGRTVTVSLSEIYNIIQYWLLNMYRMGGIIDEVAHRSIIKQGYLGDGSEGERKRWGHGRGVGGGGGVKSNWSFWWGTNNHWLRSKSQQQQRCGHRHTDRTTKWLRPPYAAPLQAKRINAALLQVDKRIWADECKIIPSIKNSDTFYWYTVESP